MTTAAESPGAEVQQLRPRKKKLSSNMPFYSGFLVTLSVFLAAMLTPICGCDDDTGKALANVKVLEINVTRFKTLTGALPDSLEDLVHQPENFSDRWKPLMQATMLNDPWGEPYQYRTPGTMNPGSHDLFSKGPDKTEGTDDDIGNWQ